MRIAALLLVITLAACSGDAPAGPDQANGPTRGAAANAADPPVPITGSGEYTFTHAGAAGTVTVPTASTDTRVAEYEEYRKLAGAIAVTYVASDIDNRNGAETITMYRVVVITDDGRQIEAPNISVRLATWRDAFSSTGSGDVQAYDRGVELEHAIQPLPPGTSGTLINAAAQLVPSVARVFVYPTGGLDRVEAVKSS
jgi:hypothetical protein